MKTIVIIQCEENIIGFTNTEDEAAKWVKANWGYDDEKIEYERKQGFLAFRVIEKVV